MSLYGHGRARYPTRQGIVRFMRKAGIVRVYLCTRPDILFKLDRLLFRLHASPGTRGAAAHNTPFIVPGRQYWQRDLMPVSRILPQPLQPYLPHDPLDHPFRTVFQILLIHDLVSMLNHPVRALFYLPLIHGLRFATSIVQRLCSCSHRVRTGCPSGHARVPCII